MITTLGLAVFTAMLVLIAAVLRWRSAGRTLSEVRVIPGRPARVTRLADPGPTFDERMAASVTALDHSDVLAIVCRACNDEDGPCTCAGLCGHRDCVGDHTVLHDMAAELEAMLDGGGHEDCDELGRP